MSLGMMVTRFAWRAHKLLSSNIDTMNLAGSTTLDTGISDHPADSACRCQIQAMRLGVMQREDDSAASWRAMRAWDWNLKTNELSRRRLRAGSCLAESFGFDINQNPHNVFSFTTNSDISSTY